MSSHPVPTRRSHLVLGAALLGCSLVSAEADAIGLASTTLQSLSGSMTIGSYTATWSKPGAPQYSWSSFQTGVGVGAWQGEFNYMSALDLGSSYGRVQVALGFSASQVSWFGSGSGFFTLTFATRVRFSDGSSNSLWLNPTWSVGGNSITSNDEFAAGTYTFNWSFSSAGVASHNYYRVRSYFYEVAGGGGVPLPGAAGLAACGLLGLSRRRRR